MTRRRFPVPKHFCRSYCQHGGVCELERGHTTKHDSGYCQWTDSEAISREAADALTREKSPELAALLSAAEDVIALIDPDDD